MNSYESLGIHRHSYEGPTNPYEFPKEFQGILQNRMEFCGILWNLKELYRIVSNQMESN